jgi:hypothetical protein
MTRAKDISKIVSDADFGGTLDVAGVVTANAGVVVDNITIDGQEIDVSSGDLTLDVAGDINLDTDAGEINLKDGGTLFGLIINSSSDLVIQSATQDKDLIVKGNDGGAVISALTLDMSDAGTAVFNHDIKLNDAQMVRFGSSQDSDIAHYSDNQLALRNTTGVVTFYTGGTPTERVRIDASGYIFVATNGAEPSASQVGVSIKGVQGQNFWKSANSGTTGYDHLKFFNGNGAVGSIFTNGSGTTYSTSSDYRLKENVTYDFDATSRLKQLKPSRFNFIADADTTVDGFLAHEVSSIVPEAIGGTKDATEDITDVVLNADGTVNSDGVSQSDWTAGKSEGTYANDTTWVASKTVPKYQGIDQSKLVPLLTKALQEQQATIEALTARITALEEA